MKATLQSITHENDHIVTFNFKTERKLPYTAGQYIELTVDHASPDERGAKRWFTLSSSPTEELVSITTKFAGQKSSSFKTALFEKTPGDSVIISEPMGDFVLPKNPDIPLLMVAGGIGITPMRSMLAWLRDNNQSRTIRLLYSVKLSDDVVFKSLLSSHADLDIFASDGNTSVKRTLSSKIIAETAATMSSPLIYISGPEQMVEMFFAELKSHGIEEHHLVGDYFPGYAGI